MVSDAKLVAALPPPVFGIATISGTSLYEGIIILFWIFGNTSVAILSEGDAVLCAAIRVARGSQQETRILLSWPGAEDIVTTVACGEVAGKVIKAGMLGHAGDLAFKQDATGLRAAFPAQKPCDFAYALKITGLKGK
jgi:hypothetical protein